MTSTKDRPAAKKGSKKAERKRKLHNRERDHQPSSSTRKYMERNSSQMTSLFDQLFVPRCPPGYS